MLSLSLGMRRIFASAMEGKLLNDITLGQCQPDNINRMITILVSMYMVHIISLCRVIGDLVNLIESPGLT
jgi:hypothetical protein